MLSSVNSVAGGAQSNAKAQLEARRQEILKSAQEEGGAQARAVRTGARQADAAQQFRTPPRDAQGREATGQTGGAATNTGGAAPKTQTSGASAQGQATKNTNPGSGWRDRIRRWDAPEETGKQPESGKGTKVDVTA